MDYDNMDFGPAYTKNVSFKDAWGCIWETSVNGIEGVVQNAPLSDWDSLKSYAMPNAATQTDRGLRDWQAEREEIERKRAEGRITAGSVPHGFLFQRIQYLRGFEDAMIDFATGDPRLKNLIDRLVGHNLVIIRNYLDSLSQVQISVPLSTKPNLCKSKALILERTVNACNALC